MLFFCVWACGGVLFKGVFLNAKRMNGVFLVSKKCAWCFVFVFIKVMFCFTSSGARAREGQGAGKQWCARGAGKQVEELRGRKQNCSLFLCSFQPASLSLERFFLGPVEPPQQRVFLALLFYCFAFLIRQ